MYDWIDQEPDQAEVSTLYRLIDVADDSSAACLELLFRLEFITGSRSLYKLNVSFLNIVDKYLNPIIIAAVIFALIAAVVDETRVAFLSSVLATLSIYFTWIRNQRSKNVDDALKRKDLANSMIVQYHKLLIPYTGNVFEFEAKYAEQHLKEEDQVTIDMYVFAEIDNLEYVFEKSRARLIEDKYVVRAIRIFVARAENKGFYKVAKRLIINGRYNENFVHATMKLLNVARLDASQLTKSIFI